MREGVDAQKMPFIQRAFNNFRVLQSIFANDEEGGRNVVLFQNIKNFRCQIFVRPIIKR